MTELVRNTGEDQPTPDIELPGLFTRKRIKRMVKFAEGLAPGLYHSYEGMDGTVKIGDKERKIDVWGIIGRGIMQHTTVNIPTSDNGEFPPVTATRTTTEMVSIEDNITTVQTYDVDASTRSTLELRDVNYTLHLLEDLIPIEFVLPDEA